MFFNILLFLLSSRLHTISLSETDIYHLHILLFLDTCLPTISLVFRLMFPLGKENVIGNLLNN